jgi:hypothetical protein
VSEVNLHTLLRRLFLFAGDRGAVTNSEWRGFVIQTAPLNVKCEKSADWANATSYLADAVGVKDGYNEITWDSTAEIIWGSNLNTNNTILWRTRIPQP